MIAGLVYNYLPFMLLPIYVALERIDPSLLEAAGDLYATRRQTFLRIVFPLTVPGIFAGVLLTFVPVVSDYVNASILGGTGQTMIGNIIQTLYLTNSDYPNASALSIVLMGILMIGIFILQQFPAHKTLRPAAIMLLSLGGAQLILGILAYVMRILAAEQPVGMVIATVAHVAVGASTLAASIALSIQIRRNVRPAIRTADEPQAVTS